MKHFLIEMIASLSRKLPALSCNRRMSFAVPRYAETLEERTLLSAVTGTELEHEYFDTFGNEYEPLTELPDANFVELGPADGTGNFDGTSQIADLSQTFFLHSNPGADHTIYLDFDGHLTSGTTWNSAFTGGASFYTPAYSFDGDASFSESELATIQAIWQRVAEDFLPFDVNVTTEDPGSSALSRSGGGDQAWGIRVVIGGDGAWYGSAGGVAYRNSFNWSDDAPAFVFEDQVANGNEKYTTDAITHEVGHTLGLSHDGTSGTAYYQGHGGGETGWASIMGVGYYQNLTQWSKGEYSGANNREDDLAIITSQNGFGYRADDVGNTAGTAGTLYVSGGIVQDSGIIERNTDVDVYVFSTGAGTIDFQGLVAGRGANLDILLELYNSSGQLVASANPYGQLSASFSVTVSAGIYYLHVSGVGEGDPLGTGYTDYGSLGSYRLAGSIIESGQTFPSYLAISPANVDKNEGHSGSTAFTFIVSRSGDTNTGVSVGFVVSGNGADVFDFAGGTFPGGTVTFAAGETSKTITIYVAGDTVIEGDEGFTVALVNASSGAEITTATANGTIRNDDQPGILVTPTSGLTTSESGGSNTFSVVLTHAPTSDVTISVASGNTLEGTVNVSQLVFSPTNWNVAQTVIVTGVDDAVRDGNVQYLVVLGNAVSSDANYSGMSAADVQVTNQDNDKGGKPGGSADDGGGGSTKGGKGGGPKKTLLPEGAEASGSGSESASVQNEREDTQISNDTEVWGRIQSETDRPAVENRSSEAADDSQAADRVIAGSTAARADVDELFEQFGTALGDLI